MFWSNGSSISTGFNRHQPTPLQPNSVLDSFFIKSPGEDPEHTAYLSKRGDIVQLDDSGGRFGLLMIILQPCRIC